MKPSWGDEDDDDGDALNVTAWNEDEATYEDDQYDDLQEDDGQINMVSCIIVACEEIKLMVLILGCGLC